MSIAVFTGIAGDRAGISSSLALGCHASMQKFS